MAVTTTSISVKDASGTSQSLAVFTDPASVLRQIVSLDDAGMAVYRASANFTPQATNAVTLISIQGSASKTVRVRRITLCGVSTALSASNFCLQRTTALGAGGTTVSPTIQKVDSGTVASATALVSHYTATLKAAGTGSVANQGLANWLQHTSTVTTPTVAVVPTTSVWPDAGGPAGQTIVLRGTADFLEVQNVTPASLGAGTVLAYVIEWVEDAS